MTKYSKEIIKINDNYLIMNYNKLKFYLSYIILIVSTIMLLTLGFIIVNSIKEIGFSYNDLAVIIFLSIYFLPFFLIANDIKYILININEKIIIFKYGIFPFINIKKVNIDKIKEISINCNIDHYKNNNTIYKFYETIEIDYNVDLIDHNLNAYTLFQSKEYNEDINIFAEKIRDIIKKELKNNYSTEGINIYKKKII